MKSLPASRGFANKISTSLSIKFNVASTFWVPGEILIKSGDFVGRNSPIRSGNSSTNAAIVIRGKDIGSNTILGRIEGEEQHRATVQPGQGLSLFIKRFVLDGYKLIEEQPPGSQKTTKKLLEARARELGYEKLEDIRWFQMAENKKMPAGLELVFDNKPLGHCTLTVSRGMSVHEYLHLIEEHLDFTYIGTGVVATGKKE